jgi:DNA-directed RNA polymerase specialized sigma24 family protein
VEKNDLKRKLHRYRDLEAERQQIALELKKMEEFLGVPKGTSWDGMPKAPGVGDPVLGVVTQHLALQERYRRQLEKLASAQAEIEDLIEGLEPLERKLMRHRYIEGLGWEAVCVAMCYSWRQTHRIHSTILDKILEQVAEE